MNEQYNGYTIRIEQDTDAQNPFEHFDQAGTLRGFLHNYDFSGKDGGINQDELMFELSGIDGREYADRCINSFEDLVEHYNENPHLCKKYPIFYGKTATYDAEETARRAIFKAVKNNAVVLELDFGYSAEKCSASEPNDSYYDEKAEGFLYITKENILKEYGGKIVTKATREKAIKLLKAEAETMNDYLSGNVWGYIVEDQAGNDLDSCWGFYGDQKYCIDEAKSIVDYYVREEAKIAQMMTT